MERKTEDFFDGDKVNMTKVMQHLSQHPDKMDQILSYVIEKVEHFTEFRTKKEHLKEKYDHKLRGIHGGVMNFNDFMGSLKWDFLKSRLIALWVEPHTLEGVDFNNMDQLNKLAEQIVPWLIKSNPNIANLIKQNANLVGDKKEEVVQVIDKL